jgi:hypothetical protein
VALHRLVDRETRFVKARASDVLDYVGFDKPLGFEKIEMENRAGGIDGEVKIKIDFAGAGDRVGVGDNRGANVGTKFRPNVDRDQENNPDKHQEADDAARNSVEADVAVAEFREDVESLENQLVTSVTVGGVPGTFLMMYRLFRKSDRRFRSS